MMRFLPYVLKNLWRQRTRSGLTVGGAAVGLFLFCAVGAVREGLDRLTQARQNDRRLIVFQANRFCPFTSRLPEDYERGIRKLPGVAGVTPVQLFMNNCRASLDLVVFYGFPPDRLRGFRDFALVAGDWATFAGRQDGALVGKALARRRGLDIGAKFTVGEVTVSVAGIFASPEAAEDNYLYCHLDFLQRTRSLNAVGLATQFEVQLDETTDADAVCRAIDEAFRGGPVATDTRTKGAFQANAVGDLVELIAFANYLGWASVGLVLALVGTTTVMTVQDRTRELAVLQTLGCSGPRVYVLVVAESLVLGLAGGGIGVATATAVLAWGGLSLGTEGVSIAFLPSARLAATGLAVALATGVLAGALPAWQAARAEIVAALRYV